MRRRDAGDRGGLDAAMAVTAIEAEAADVMLVAERHRLVGGQGTSGSVFRGRNPIGNSDGQERPDENAETVRAIVSA